MILRRQLLVDPRVKAALPVDRSIWEPQSNLLVSTLHRVTPMDHVPANVNCKVPTDGSRLGCCWVCGSNDLSPSDHNILPFPDHCNNRSGDNVINETTEEGLGRQVLVVLLSERALNSDQLQACVNNSVDE